MAGAGRSGSKSLIVIVVAVLAAFGVANGQVVRSVPTGVRAIPHGSVARYSHQGAAGCSSSSGNSDQSPVPPAAQIRLVVEHRNVAIFEGVKKNHLQEALEAATSTVQSKRIVLSDGTGLGDTDQEIVQLQDSTRPLFEEIESLDPGTAIVHSDDARQIYVVRTVGDHTIAYATRDHSIAEFIIDQLPAKTTLVMSGRTPELALATTRFTMHRLLDTRVPIRDAVEYAQPSRVVMPRAVINGVPRTEMELSAQGLAPSGLAAYQRLALAVEAWAKGLGHETVSSKESFLELLRNGNEDFAIVIAHSDGKRLYIGDEQVSLKEIEKLPLRDKPAQRTIIMAVCNAGKTSVRLGQLQGFAQLFLEKGFAASIVAPTDTIGEPQVKTLIESFGGSLETLLDQLRGINGNWRLLVQSDRRVSHEVTPG